jgi:antitoxin component YwqK of YwqJK toxin-antitoxin module
MAKKPKDYILHHKDGSLWATGKTLDGVATGYWEWFRKDGTRMRSGFFEKGEQTGVWTTYDKSGAVYKVTTMRAKAK